MGNIQTTQNASYGSRNISNSQGSELLGHMDFFALVDRPVDVQKTFADNFGLTRQSRPAIINREYVIDYTNPYNRDLAVYEEGSYVTNYTYGLGLDRISQTVMNYPNKTEVGIEGQNSYTDLAVEKYSKLYLHQDRLGSTIRMTRENGTTIAWADYDEWGKPRSPRDFDMNMASVDNAIGFTSYTYDTVLDKFFAQARFYDADNRRFTQIDPTKDGLNWYAYVGNNPILFVDPSGLVQVGLRAYAETYKNSTVEWNATTRTATVTYNGKTLSIESTATNTTDGRIYVDDSLFVNRFGIGCEKLVVYQDAVTESISIRANFNITGNAASDIFENSTYTYFFLNGIEQHWSGSFDGYEVSTYARKNSNGIKVNIGEVNLKAKKDNSHMTPPSAGWSPTNPGSITMRTGDSRTGTIYTADQFRWVSAHEFGHILGVADAYSSQNSTDVTSIFNNFGTAVQSNDITKVLKAWNTKKWQSWE